MKKLITGIFLITALASSAQIDRTKEPQAGPAPEIHLGIPQTFELKNGLKVIVVENHKLPRVAYTLTLDNPPYTEGEKAGTGSLMGSLLGKGSATIEKDAFYEEVDYMGAFINFNSSGAVARGLSKYSSRILEMMADAALNPNFTQEEFEKEQNILLDGLKSSEKSVSAVAGRVGSALAYGLNHPYGEYTSKKTVKNVKLNDVTAHYRNYFVPKNAYLVVVGDVDYLKIKQEVTDLFELWRKASPPAATLPKPANAQYTQIDFVDMPNAVQSEIAVENLVDLKMTDEDYFPALLANKVLGGSFRSYLNTSLREDKGYTYGAGSQIGADKYVSRFKAAASVRNAVTDSAIVVFMDQLKRIRNEKVHPQDMAIAKAEYVGEFVMALENPETIARYALNILTENLPQDFYITYLEKINAVNAADVQGVAQKFIKPENARIVVVGKGSDVLAHLEKITLNGKSVPMKFFDPYAAPQEKPDYEAAIPEGVTAKDVLNKYIDALGGKDKLKAVESYVMLAEAEMQGMKLDLEMKKTTKNQFVQDLKVMGNSMSKQVLNGNQGYIVMQGQRKDMGEKELLKAKEEAALFPELNYLDKEIALEGLETVDGKKAYKLKLSDEKTAFFDIKTGLKIQEITNLDMGGQTMASTTNFSNYQEVGGIQFPYAIAQTVGPQSFDFIVSEIKINDGVTDADFE